MEEILSQFEAVKCMLVHEKESIVFTSVELVFPINVTVTVCLEEENEKTFQLDCKQTTEESEMEYYCRTSWMNSKQQEKLNKSLNIYVKDDLCGIFDLWSTIDYLREILVEISQQMKKSLDLKPLIEEEYVQLQRQWYWFIGFYSKDIRKDFVQVGSQLGLTGFLVPGKPAIGCCEGAPNQVQAFTKAIRTDVFACVDKSARKMSLPLLEDLGTFSIGDSDSHRAFSGFEEVELMSEDGSHKRKDLVDMGKLRAFLRAHECEHVFNDVWGQCL
eukprot:TRINITY_DN1427_c0_g1_i1.p1 TRINITY_DN1427_c0_g1~~TRINITY_DN1427_c0_g1_i1.p1  ORF type:complete len:300 (-),score=46.58 TRINITY_DN1427_c0_g1_i1:32-850(-)